MARCELCGAELVPGAKFCNKCGAVAPKTCPQCGGFLKAGAKFCSDCGERLHSTFWLDSGICIKCGKPLKAGAKFCSACGEPCGFSKENAETKKDSSEEKLSQNEVLALKSTCEKVKSEEISVVEKKNFSADDFSERTNMSSHLPVIIGVVLAIVLVVGVIYYFVNGENNRASKFADDTLKTYLELQNSYFAQNKDFGSTSAIGLFIENTPDFKIDNNDKSRFSFTSQRNIGGCPQFTVWEIKNIKTTEYNKEKNGMEYQHHVKTTLHYECSVNVKFDEKHEEKQKACERLIPDFESLCTDIVVDTIVSVASTMKDSRDGKIYKTVKIGSQIWMGENLNFKMDSSWCYGDNSANCTKHGRLYSWNAANKSCPKGWHLPDLTEFEQLFDVVGIEQAGNMLKSSSEWYMAKNVARGVDSYGFSVLPTGARSSKGHFYYEGYDAFLWTSTNQYNDDAYYINFDYERDYVKKNYEGKSIGVSVRCVKD